MNSFLHLPQTYSQSVALDSFKIQKSKCSHIYILSILIYLPIRLSLFEKKMVITKTTLFQSFLEMEVFPIVLSSKYNTYFEIFAIWSSLAYVIGSEKIHLNVLFEVRICHDTNKPAFWYFFSLDSFSSQLNLSFSNISLNDLSLSLSPACRVSCSHNLALMFWSYWAKTPWPCASSTEIACQIHLQTQLAGDICLCSFKMAEACMNDYQVRCHPVVRHLVSSTTPEPLSLTPCQANAFGNLEKRGGKQKKGWQAVRQLLTH